MLKFSFLTVGLGVSVKHHQVNFKLIKCQSLNGWQVIQNCCLILFLNNIPALNMKVSLLEIFKVLGLLS